MIPLAVTVLIGAQDFRLLGACRRSNLLQLPSFSLLSQLRNSGLASLAYSTALSSYQASGTKYRGCLWQPQIATPLGARPVTKIARQIQEAQVKEYKEENNHTLISVWHCLGF